MKSLRQKEKERFTKLDRRSATIRMSRELKRQQLQRNLAMAEAPKGSYGEVLLQAGIRFSSTVWIGIAISSALIGAIASYILLGGLVALVLFPTTLIYLLISHPAACAEKRRQQVVPHLPGFIDTLAAALRTGYSMEASIEQAVTALPDGILKREFEKVVQLLKKHVPLEEAIPTVSRNISGQEVVSLSLTIRLFTGIGGRVLEPLKHLGAKMREQENVLEKASRELVGTKQAFYVIFALSVLAPLFLMGSEPEYLLKAFRNPVIGLVMQGAIATQIICMFYFKRLIALKV